jgi:hypothetical protein
MGRISRGWTVTKQSWGVLKSDRSLVIFPILSTIFAILAVVAIWAPTAAISGVLETETINERDPAYYVAIAATAYVSTFIATFFNVALASCAVRSLRGEDTKVGEGLAAALRLIGAIVGWSLVAATVGLILRLVEDRVPAVGKIAVWIAGAAWAIAAFFVIPVIALEGGGPWSSLKRSAAVVKARWGEGATGTVAISAVTGLAIGAIVFVGAVGGFALSGIGLLPLAITVVAIAVASVIVVSIISSALGGIFRVAVYQYAVTGETPGGFDSKLVQTAFDGRTRRGLI